ncbi:hypothetical protein [Lacibacter sediminis]|uniref:Uncharacterized protein n=1 Tax=Lacibacter sediminis TaxID=2760713 RepID=A0A7G5XIN5_9BACT|nr:hypothetical protein [Lacibacter sediminis]QNA45338.1 hypothetical protein H4075_03805 [Lacibacter sediminis]
MADKNSRLPLQPALKKAKVLQKVGTVSLHKNKFFPWFKSIKKVEIKQRKIWQIKIAAYLCNPL